MFTPSVFRRVVIYIWPFYRFYGRPLTTCELLPDVVPDTVAAAEVRLELSRVLASPGLRHSGRMRALLSYLIEEMLAGRSSRLKEYSIALHVFGRDESFDPRIDTLVRNEAWRLRSRLSKYYEGEGANNPLRIELPNRSFTPVVRRTGNAAPHIPRPVASAVPYLIGLQPLQDRGEIAQAQGLGDRIIEELRVELSSFTATSLVVVPLGTPDGHAWAREHGANALLTGSVSSDGRQTRVIVHLIAADNRRQIWAHAFDLEGVDIAQRSARGIADALADAPNTPWSELQIEEPNDASADVWFRGLLRFEFGTDSRTLRSLRRRMAMLERRLTQRPDDAATQRRLACAMAEFISRVPQTGSDLLPRLQQVALHAAASDQSAVEPLLALGMVSLLNYDWPSASHALGQVLSRAAELPAAKLARGLCHMQMGDLTAACSDIADARDRAPHSAWITAGLGNVKYQMRQFDEARSLARRAVALDPDFEPGHVLLADCELGAGRRERGISMLEDAHRQTGGRPTTLGRLGHALALSGRRARALELLEPMFDDISDEHAPCSAIANIYLGLNERDHAFRWLDRAVDQHVVPELLLRSDPRYDPLRGDPRFGKLARRMNLDCGKPS